MGSLPRPPYRSTFSARASTDPPIFEWMVSRCDWRCAACCRIVPSGGRSNSTGMRLNRTTISVAPRVWRQPSTASFSNYAGPIATRMSHLSDQCERSSHHGAIPKSQLGQPSRAARRRARLARPASLVAALTSPTNVDPAAPARYSSTFSEQNLDGRGTAA